MAQELQDTPMADALIRNWSDLPSDLLIRILGCMNSRVYHLLLRAVCPAWRSALPLSGDGRPLHHHQPWLQSNIDEYVLFLISSLENEKPNWVTPVKETNANKWTFLNPLTGERFRFPRGAKIEEVNLLDYRITMLWRSLVLQSAGPFTKIPICLPSSSNDSCVSMGLSGDGFLLLFQSGFEEWVSFYPKDAFGEEPEVKGYGLWCSDCRYTNGFKDIISYKGRFYAVDGKGRLVVFDPLRWCEPVLVVTCPLKIDNGMSAEVYIHLVESEGSLYLVVKRVVEWFLVRNYYPDSDVMIHVFVLTEEKGEDAKWDEVKSIGDRVFVIGKNASFSLSSSTSVLSKTDCIYFRGERDRDPEAETALSQATYYLLDDECLRSQGVWYGLEGYYTKLFWPPPTWICDLDPRRYPFEHLLFEDD